VYFFPPPYTPHALIHLTFPDSISSINTEVTCIPVARIGTAAQTMKYWLVSWTVTCVISVCICYPDCCLPQSNIFTNVTWW